jgi:hypothetical protein
MRIPPAPALASAGLPRRVREALDTVHGLVFELLVDPFDRLLPELEPRVAHIQDRGAQHAVGVAYLDPVQMLQRRGRAFISRFMQEIDEELAGLRAAPRDAAAAADASALRLAFDDLRLVDEDEVDEETEVRAIALRAESRAALPLQLLCQRFAVLAASPAFDPSRLPVGPRRLSELLLRAADASGFGIGLRVALLQEFDRRVLAQYPAFAEALNALLAQQRVMPGLSYVPLRPRPRVAPAAADAIPERERPLTGWTPQPLAEADTVTFQLLQELLAGRRTLADRFRGPGQPMAAARPELDTEAVLGLLEHAEPASLPRDFEGMRQWLLLQARHQRGQAVALAPHDADTFELLGMMYAHIASQLRAGSSAAGMLDQLRVPLLRLALVDPGFFVRSAHPAREVLNAVAETGAAWHGADGTDPQLVQHLQRVVDEIARPNVDVAGAFRGAVQALEAQYQALARRSEISERRHVEAARGKEKLAVARRRSTAVIEDALAGVRLPLFHRNMLRQAWADALTLAHLRYGEDSTEWQGLVDATRELVRAGAGLAEAPAELQPQAEQWLATVGYHADDAARISRILTATVHEEDDDAASRTELALRLKSRARLGEDAVPEEADLPPRTAAEQAQYERARTLPFGTWIEFDEAEGRVRRRLSWLSPVTGNVLFVNLRGQRAGESTLDMLARRLAAGTARVVTAGEGRLVDRAWRAALQSLRGLAGGSQEAPA